MRRRLQAPAGADLEHSSIGSADRQFERRSPSLTLKRLASMPTADQQVRWLVACPSQSYLFNSRSMSTWFPFGIIQEYVPDWISPPARSTRYAAAAMERGNPIP